MSRSGRLPPGAVPGGSRRSHRPSPPPFRGRLTERPRRQPMPFLLFRYNYIGASRREQPNFLTFISRSCLTFRLPRVATPVSRACDLSTHRALRSDEKRTPPLRRFTEYLDPF